MGTSRSIIWEGTAALELDLAADHSETLLLPHRFPAVVSEWCQKSLA